MGWLNPEKVLLDADADEEDADADADEDSESSAADIIRRFCIVFESSGEILFYK